MQTWVLFDCDFVGGIIKFAGMSGEEQGDVHLKLDMDGPPEGRAVGEVEGGDLGDYWEPTRKYHALHGP